MEHRRSASETVASVLASAVRLRIIRLTRHEALTNKELAERLGRDPATTLHHVRRLVDAGLLTAQPPRRGNRGAREIPYRSSGLPWIRRPAGEPGVAAAMIQAYLTEVGELDPDEVVQFRFVLDLAPARLEEFQRRLEDLLHEFDHDPPAPDTARTAFYAATYPNP